MRAFGTKLCGGRKLVAAVRAPAHQWSGTLFAEFCPSFIGMLAVGALHGGTAPIATLHGSDTLAYQQDDARYGTPNGARARSPSSQGGYPHPASAVSNRCLQSPTLQPSW